MSYWLLMATIAFSDGHTETREIYAVAERRQCDVKNTPDIALKPLKGEVSRRYGCKEVRYELGYGD